ncbi:ABC transporter permease subunit [Catellatospora sichuanensis]|uniref:ABC transporter permease subunit n=1 Tax=Catellatospora sichuanensis TaxID=1969805 RepID=UPI001182814C|nr:ABC transporter permease subunit [Catellatospora sichuanensis]
MIWFTWRQLRAQTVLAAAALAAFGVLLFVTALLVTDLYADVAACTSDCDGVTKAFILRFNSSAAFTAHVIALAALYVLPALIGIFWGAPLIAREVETGTHRLAWNQSVTRTRWLVAKLTVGGALAVAATGLLSLGLTVWAQRIDSASQDRINPLIFGARGIVPVAYALFAFLLGATLGMLIRRTLPAMATTLAVYVAAAAAMPLWVRGYLVPSRHDTIPLIAESIHGMSISGDTGAIEVFGDGVANAWTVSNRTITASGATFTGPADPAVCGMEGVPAKCHEWMASLGLRQDLLYHPDSHFWSLQWAEAGVLIGLAALLAAFCFWWIRHRIV